MKQQTPVRRTESFYLPPPSLPANAWDFVPPAERVWRWYEHTTQRRVVPPAGMLIGATVQARINHGRWVADCLCGSAQVVTPGDPRFACPECGWGWARIVFPERVAEAEAAVTARAPHEQNWWAADDDSWDRPRPTPPARDKPGPPTRGGPGGQPPTDDTRPTRVR
ncbi:hypothetical protein [Streptomyces sp. NPDC001194]|uniref:hypothetical protein n=1 Tax=Streptomyces sp. NPDC001194 TaxID=3364547 RepID=UPI0036888FAA